MPMARLQRGSGIFCFARGVQSFLDTFVCGYCRWIPDHQKQAPFSPHIRWMEFLVFRHLCGVFGCSSPRRQALWQSKAGHEAHTSKFGRSGRSPPSGPLDINPMSACPFCSIGDDRRARTCRSSMCAQF